MPTLKIEKKSLLDPKETFNRISNLLENDKDLRKLDPKLNCSFNSSAMSGEAKGAFFKAEMTVTAASAGSVVKISVELPFHLALVKGMVEKTLNKKLEETLA